LASGDQHYSIFYRDHDPVSFSSVMTIRPRETAWLVTCNAV
jgi:hypothetical protein